MEPSKWTAVNSYKITADALRAWVGWRFAEAISQGAVVKVKAKDGNFNVYAPEELDKDDKKALKKALKGAGKSWTPPDETWEEFCLAEQGVLSV